MDEKQTMQLLFTGNALTKIGDGKEHLITIVASKNSDPNNTCWPLYCYMKTQREDQVSEE